MWNGKYQNFLTIDFPEVNDILGLLYQSLTAEGNKSQAGSYYTPKRIVDEVVAECVQLDFVVLDPCCGTGQFLLSASEKVKNPLQIWGFDIDELAVKIARINMILRFSDREFSPNIFCKNTLLEVDSGSFFSHEIPHFDAIITNPPWGAHFSKNQISQLQKLYPAIQSGEIFSYFITKSMNLLKEGGMLSFILPESILNIKTHKDIREVIVKQSKIRKIMYLDRVFKNVFTPIIRLDIIKENFKQSNIFKAVKNGIIREIEQARLKNNSGYVFDVFADDTDIHIIEKIYNYQHITLKNNAEWGLGIVTGDNKKHLSDTHKAGYEPILTGKDIHRFLVNSATNYICYKPEKFQQSAPENKYRAKEKLIYKFISKELIFAYDDKQMLTLNSANFLIPALKNYPLKTILALFNSAPYQFIFQKKFAALKILRGDIEKLPLPYLDEKQHSAIEILVNKLLDIAMDRDRKMEIYRELDFYIMRIFSLNNEEQNYVLNNITISNKFLFTE